MPASASTDTRPEWSPQVTLQPMGDRRCGVCPHAVDHHDDIGLRFCRATRNSGIERGCVCRPG
jgi:hypothetical protein